MNWSDGANLYLLKSVNKYGKNWNLVSSALSVIADTFLKCEKLKDFSVKSCSLQYKYLIASLRQTEERFRYLGEEDLLPIAISRFTDLRGEQIKQKKTEIWNKIKLSAEDDKKLLEGRYSELSFDSLLTYRKRCRAFNLPDVIGEALHLEALPINLEEDKLVRRNIRYSDHADNGLCHSTLDPDNGLWIPVASEQLKNFFNPKSTSPILSWNSGFVHTDENVFIEDKPPLQINTSPDWSIDKTSDAESKVRVSEEIVVPASSSINRVPKVRKRSMQSEIGSQNIKRSAPSSPPLIPSETNDIKNVISPVSLFTGSTDNLSAKETPRRSRTAINLFTKTEFAMSSTTTTPTHSSQASRHRFHPSSDVATINSPLPSESHHPNQNTGSPSLHSVASMGRRWRRGLLSALSTVCNHRHAHIFVHAVTNEIAPGYSNMVLEPIDLTNLRKRVEASLTSLVGSVTNDSVYNPAVAEAIIIKTAKQLLRDLLLMFVNARMYNNRDHTVHRMAWEMFADVFAELRPLWSVLAEDIDGFPPLPGKPMLNASTLRRRNIHSTHTVHTQSVTPSSSTNSPAIFNAANILSEKVIV